ncbi:MAG: replication-relaxation family protein [Pseudomonadota bacterium]
MIEKRIQVTDRDREIVSRLSELRVLEKRQIAWLFFDNEATAANRLWGLGRNEYLRKSQPFGDGGPAYWSVGPAGIREFGLFGARYDSPYLVSHQLGLNWVYCGLAGRRERNRPQFRWTDGQAVELSGGGTVIRPDAIIDSKDRSKTVLLEYDNGTKALLRIRDNLKRYAQWSWSLPGVPHVLLYSVKEPGRREAIGTLWRRISARGSKLSFLAVGPEAAPSTIAQVFGIDLTGDLSQPSHPATGPAVLTILRDLYEALGVIAETLRLPEIKAMRKAETVLRRAGLLEVPEEAKGQEGDQEGGQEETQVEGVGADQHFFQQSPSVPPSTARRPHPLNQERE